MNYENINQCIKFLNNNIIFPNLFKLIGFVIAIRELCHLVKQLREQNIANILSLEAELNNQKANVAKNDTSNHNDLPGIENWLNTLDRFCLCISKKYFKELNWEDEYKWYIDDVMYSYPKYFDVFSEYTNIIALYKKWNQKLIKILNRDFNLKEYQYKIIFYKVPFVVIQDEIFENIDKAKTQPSQSCNYGKNSFVMMKKSCFDNDKYHWKEHEIIHCLQFKKEIKETTSFNDLPNEYPNCIHEINPYMYQVTSIYHDKKNELETTIDTMLKCMIEINHKEKWLKTFFSKLLEKAKILNILTNTNK